MAHWLHYISLISTILFFIGVVAAAIYVGNLISAAIASTKESLKQKGFNISEKGIDVKTNKRLDREDYMDATQRGLISAMKASSFGAPDSQVKLDQLDTPPTLRKASSASSKKKE